MENQTVSTGYSFNFFIERVGVHGVLIYVYWDRGRHASKLTEEEEDEECLKEEEDGLSGTGNTRLVMQPSCKFSLFLYACVGMLLCFLFSHKILLYY